MVRSSIGTMISAGWTEHLGPDGENTACCTSSLCLRLLRSQLRLSTTCRITLWNLDPLRRRKHAMQFHRHCPRGVRSQRQLLRPYLDKWNLCSDTVFGDPDVGVAKSCYYQVISSAPTGLPSGNWTFCASEWGQCSFAGQALVEFGASGHFTGLTLTNGTLCAYTIFGDPDVGVAKGCYFQTVAQVPQVSGLPPGTWTLCASEWGQCSFAGQALVEFGASGHFTGLSLSNGTLCANTIFGDPDVGVAKSCYYQSTSTGTVDRNPR